MQISKLIPIFLLASGFVLVGEENGELVMWMKTSKTALEALQKMDPKSGQHAVRSAERMGSVYEEMIGFWRQRNVNDAVKWSQEGKAAALELATAAYAGDNEKVADSLKALTATCKQCHEAHREKIAEDKYRIK